MAQDHGLAQPNGAKAAMQVVMQVRAAYAAGAQMDANLSGSKRLPLTFLDPQIMGCVQDDCLHCRLPSSFRTFRLFHWAEGRRLTAASQERESRDDISILRLENGKASTK
jgi:hypothetical protein